MTRNVESLTEQALAVRRDVVRMLGLARSGRLASSLSIVDILVWLYWDVLKIRPEEPSWDRRDRFVLSKGHGAPALYAALANRGFFPREELWSYRRLGAMLQGYPEVHRTPGIDAPAGSLGQGPGIANGLALALGALDPSPSVYCLLGDGELQEGAVWEALLTSAHHGLSSLTFIVDKNGRQMEGRTEDVKSLEPMAEKFRAFGLSVEECDGHDFRSLQEAFTRLKRERGRPGCLIARTTLGKGVSFLEAEASDGRAVLDREAVDRALEELTREEDEE